MDETTSRGKAWDHTRRAPTDSGVGEQLGTKGILPNALANRVYSNRLFTLIGGGKRRLAKARSLVPKLENERMGHLRIGPSLEALLKKLPQTGLLFPYIATLDPSDRASEFSRRC